MHVSHHHDQRYQRRLDSTKPIENTPGTVNERIHEYVESIVRTHELGCKSIPGLTGWYVWRLEKNERGVVYRRRLPCICDSCVKQEWTTCSLKNIPGGPGEWIRQELTFVDKRGVALEKKKRIEDRGTFISRIKKNKFVGIILKEAFLERQYGIAKVLKKPYEATKSVKVNQPVCTCIC